MNSDSDSDSSSASDDEIRRKLMAQYYGNTTTSSASLDSQEGLYKGENKGGVADKDRAKVKDYDTNEANEANKGIHNHILGKLEYILTP